MKPIYNVSLLRLAARRLCGILPEDLRDEDQALYRPLLHLWKLFGGMWILCDLSHVPGYRATPHLSAPSCSEGCGPYGTVIYSRLRPRCKDCRKIAHLPPPQIIGPMYPPFVDGASWASTG